MTRLPRLADSELITALFNGTSTIFLPWKSSAKLNFGLATKHSPELRAKQTGETYSKSGLTSGGVGLRLTVQTKTKKLSKPIGPGDFSEVYS